MKGKPIDSNMIGEKAKSLCDNLKQKQGEESKGGDSISVKDGLINSD